MHAVKDTSRAAPLVLLREKGLVLGFRGVRATLSTTGSAAIRLISFRLKDCIHENPRFVLISWWYGKKTGWLESPDKLNFITTLVCRALHHRKDPP